MVSSQEKRLSKGKVALKNLASQHNHTSQVGLKIFNCLEDW